MTTESGTKILHLLKTQGPQTAQHLAGVLQMSSMGARQHLQQLQKEGLVTAFDRREKVGRPSRYWQLTESAQARFPDRHAELTLTLIDNVRDLFGEEGLERLIEKRERKIRTHYEQELEPLPSLEEKLKRLAQLRSQEGYMASVTPEGEGRWLFVENHCPICAAASRCQNFCRSELEIFRGCLNAHVERAEYLLDGDRRCAYRVEYRTADFRS